LNRRILLIRPKCVLADDGNYREGRFFTSWKDPFAPLEDHLLSPALREATGQAFVKFGVAMIQTADTLLASEICEELWSPNRYVYCVCL
jgi:NAD+ synthase (glutamine-hydrolysing)